MEPMSKDVITAGRYAGMTWCAWTDYTLFRLGEKLDADRKCPGLLDPWMKGTIFKILGEAKQTGPSYRLTPKLMKSARDILKTRAADMESLIDG